METTCKNTEKNRRFTRRFARQAISYVAVCSFLTFVNWYTSPHYWWVLWVIAGWSLGLFIPLLNHLIGCDEGHDCENK